MILYTIKNFFSNIWFAQRNADELAEVIYDYGCVICHASGGRMSKTNYHREIIYAEIDDHVNSYVDEAVKDMEDDQ